MSVRLSSKLNILQQSPLDQLPSPQPEPLTAEPELAKWVASRFNIQTTTEDGQLIIWNTYSGSMSVFSAAQRPKVRSLLTRRGVEAKAEGLVGYLKKRGFLVREETDEYRRFQLAFGRYHYRSDVLELTLLATEDCNFRCQYCYEGFTHGTMQPWVREAIKKLIEVRLPRLRQLGISWFGGEPLYGFEAIEDLAPFFHKTAEEHSLHFMSHMSTNGYLLTPEVADKLLAWGVRRYQITIDGTPENHDHNRPTRDGQPTFSTIFSNLKALHQRQDDFEIDIRVNFDKLNYPKIGEFLGLVAEEFQCDPRFKIRFRPVGRWGGPNDEDLDVWSEGESTEAMNELQTAANKRGLDSCDDLKFINRFGGQVCYAAQPYHFVIGASGKVMKCTVALDMNEQNVIGSLTPQGNFDLNVDKLALWTEPSFETDSQCQKCPILPHCHGVSCPLKRIVQGLSPCVPLRTNAKTSLLRTHRNTVDKAKRVSVANYRVSGSSRQSAQPS